MKNLLLGVGGGEFVIIYFLELHNAVTSNSLIDGV